MMSQLKSPYITTKIFSQPKVFRMTQDAASFPIKFSFTEVTFLLRVAENGLKSATAADREKASPVVRPFYNLLFAKKRRVEYTPLLQILYEGVTASKAYGSCEIALTPAQKAMLNEDYVKYQQGNAVAPEQKKGIDKINGAGK